VRLAGNLAFVTALHAALAGCGTVRIVSRLRGEMP
jgi:hypothetical protein